MKRIDLNKGFTIVETLVAIAVLMIAIAGPLVVASKGLTGAFYARDEMTASFLAQESMEFLKNYRDNGLFQASGPWLTFGNFDISANCTSASGCDASPLDAAMNGGNGITSPCPPQSSLSLASACLLYLTPNGDYVHTGNGNVPTQFYRHFYVVPVSGFTTPGSNSFNIPEVTVHVVIDWMEGTIPYEIDLASEMVDTTR